MGELLRDAYHLQEHLNVGAMAAGPGLVYPFLRERDIARDASACMRRHQAFALTSV